MNRSVRYEKRRPAREVQEGCAAGVRVGGELLREVPAHGAVGAARRAARLARRLVAPHALAARQQVHLPALALALQRRLRALAALHPGNPLLYFTSSTCLIDLLLSPGKRDITGKYI